MSKGKLVAKLIGGPYNGNVAKIGNKKIRYIKIEGNGYYKNLIGKNKSLFYFQVGEIPKSSHIATLVIGKKKKSDE